MGPTKASPLSHAGGLLSGEAQELCARFTVSKRTMKISRILLLAWAGLAAGWTTAAGAAPALSATPVPAPAPAVEVVFLEPAKFTDVRDRDYGNYERTTYLDQLREHLQRRGALYVPAGGKLAVTFTDIDMAGDFEPWRGPQFGDVRIVKDIYPPRLVIAFQLTDAAGNVVAQGKRELRDLAFLMKIHGGFRDDTMRHEKALLDDWLGQEFTRVKKA
ncbi:MAG: hypothetical protein B9S34_14200 [Opitutia bacterium Tous-C1TDCM]|nr:MAG: hypothetical protein B9S34_14200 [Opitutae bacterium Tous-C1TDCM]